MTKSRIEEAIRIKLKTQLELIEGGLSLIEDEYHLKNPNGASGFVDLFAKDSKGNLVIIELKRSDAASREAITELSKYVALLRRAKNVKNSEIRLIVVSTEWHELLVPFSEFYNATNYQLEGFHLEVDQNNNPIHLTKINPLPEISGRKVCRRHFVYYYKNSCDLERAEKILTGECLRVGIEDFIIAKLTMTIPNLYNATKVMYWAQQLQTKEFYLNKLESVLDNESLGEFLEYVEDMDPDDALDEMADKLHDETEVFRETSEIGHPEKFTQYYDSGVWELEEISKYGIFEKDERLTDELLIADLKGMTGTSFVHFFASCNTRNRSKIQEIYSDIENCLYQNDKWRHAIRDILDYSTKKDNSVITTSIYNTDDLLTTIWMSVMEIPELYKPKFIVVIDPQNDQDAEVFLGNLVWKPTEINLQQIISEVYTDVRNYFLLRHFGAHRELNGLLMAKMGFEYHVDHIQSFDRGEDYKQNIVIRGHNVIENKNPEFMTFEEFIEQNSSLVVEIVSIFQSHHAGGGIFSV